MALNMFGLGIVGSRGPCIREFQGRPAAIVMARQNFPGEGERCAPIILKAFARAHTWAITRESGRSPTCCRALVLAAIATSVTTCSSRTTSSSGIASTGEERRAALGTGSLSRMTCSSGRMRHSPRILFPAASNAPPRSAKRREARRVDWSECNVSPGLRLEPARMVGAVVVVVIRFRRTRLGTVSGADPRIRRRRQVCNCRRRRTCTPGLRRSDARGRRDRSSPPVSRRHAR